MVKKLIAGVLLLSLFTGIFASCDKPDEETTGNTESDHTNTEKVSDTVMTESETITSNVTTETETAYTETESTPTVETETEEDTTPKIEGEYAEHIENADRLKNDVNASYDASRRHYTVENGNMVLKYDLSPNDSMKATLTNTKGASYVEETMDVFVKMSSGKTYYASNSYKQAYTNIFRYGYYYYDVHIYDQSFYNDFKITKEQSLDIASFTSTNELKRLNYSDAGVTATIGGKTDPYIAGNVEIDTADCNAIRITLKANATNGNIYFKAGEKTGYSNAQMVSFQIKADGEFHTYIVPLDAKLTDSKGNNNYYGMLTGLRIDLNGVSIGDALEISEITALKLDCSDAPEIVMDRNLNVYSDKFNQVIRLIAKSDVSGIEEVGMVTEISAETVDKLIVKDKNGVKNTLEGVDWDSVEYVGFDIKGVGIFGYILTLHENSGKLTVTLNDETYVITQTTCPENGEIKAIVPATSVGDPAVNSYIGKSTDPYTSENDFIFGQRIYTDKNHDFDAFLKEAEIERAPLSANNIHINEEKTPNTTFDGYDPLRGIYCFTIKDNTSFGPAKNNHPNKHFGLSFSVSGDDKDRNIYVLAYSFTTSLECSAVLDKNDMMLPIPVEVSKNFRNEFEEPIYSWGDIRYSEARIPMKIKAGETTELTILHLYMNWGNNPLKQISSIQYITPYYHLSTGVTETNCICNMYNGIQNIKNLQMLPDHRAMSAPYFDGGTQHTAGGNHHFLQYTDSDGATYASESICNTIESAGPTYAEIDLTYLSDDGKIKATYKHIELPQLDENRAFYTMTYEVLEDVSFDNFAEDFAFYSVSGYVDYEKVGYLDENNVSQVVDVNLSNAYKFYKLGDKYPYFDMFKCSNSNDYVNVSFIIHSADFVIGGEKCEPAFVIAEKGRKCRLSLDLEEVTLKKGDKFIINAIIMPWGSQETDYSSETPDINVRNVRENTLISALIATPSSSANVLDSVFLPRIETLNGRNAEFTLTGGENNVVFRVYGFEKLTAPKLYEKIDGEWTLIDVSSLNSPDNEGHSHPYDGYSVHYDGDGTFSYSFVVKMNGGAARTFRVEAFEEFTEWPEADLRVNEPKEQYYNPIELVNAAGETASNIGKRELAENAEFIRIYGDESKAEQYLKLPIESDATGHLLVIKYRIPSENDSQINFFHIYVGTQSAKLVGSGDSLTVRSMIADGEWQVMAIDISTFGLKEFVADENGEYHPQYLRFDMFNSVMSESSYIDIAYLSLFDSFEEVLSFNSDAKKIMLVTKENDRKLIYTESGSEDPGVSELFNLYFSPGDLASAGISGAKKLELLADDSSSFVRYWGDGKSVEASSMIYRDGTEISGQYFILKYRLPVTNAEDPDKCFIEYFTSTVNSGPKGPGDEADFANTKGDKSLIKDGEWHVLVLDVTKEPTCKTFLPSEDGAYRAKFIRFDVFNGQAMSVESYMDVAFVGVCDDLAKISELLD